MGDFSDSLGAKCSGEKRRQKPLESDERPSRNYWLRESLQRTLSLDYQLEQDREVRWKMEKNIAPGTITSTALSLLTTPDLSSVRERREITRNEEGEQPLPPPV